MMVGVGFFECYVCKKESLIREENLTDLSADTVSYKCSYCGGYSVIPDGILKVVKQNLKEKSGANRTGKMVDDSIPDIIRNDDHPVYVPGKQIMSVANFMERMIGFDKGRGGFHPKVLLKRLTPAEINKTMNRRQSSEDTALRRSSGETVLRRSNKETVVRSSSEETIMYEDSIQNRYNSTNRRRSLSSERDRVSDESEASHRDSDSEYSQDSDESLPDPNDTADPTYSANRYVPIRNKSPKRSSKKSSKKSKHKKSKSHKSKRKPPNYKPSLMQNAFKTMLQKSQMFNISDKDKRKTKDQPKHNEKMPATIYAQDSSRMLKEISQEKHPSVPDPTSKKELDEEEEKRRRLKKRKLLEHLYSPERELAPPQKETPNDSMESRASISNFQDDCNDDGFNSDDTVIYNKDDPTQQQSGKRKISGDNHLKKKVKLERHHDKNCSQLEDDASSEGFALRIENIKGGAIEDFNSSETQTYKKTLSELKPEGKYPPQISLENIPRLMRDISDIDKTLREEWENYKSKLQKEEKELEKRMAEMRAAHDEKLKKMGAEYDIRKNNLEKKKDSYQREMSELLENIKSKSDEKSSEHVAASSVQSNADSSTLQGQALNKIPTGESGPSSNHPSGAPQQNQNTGSRMRNSRSESPEIVEISDERPSKKAPNMVVSRDGALLKASTDVRNKGKRTSSATMSTVTVSQIQNQPLHQTPQVALVAGQQLTTTGPQTGVVLAGPQVMQQPQYVVLPAAGPNAHGALLVNALPGQMILTPSTSSMEGIVTSLPSGSVSGPVVSTSGATGIRVGPTSSGSVRIGGEQQPPSYNLIYNANPPNPPDIVNTNPILNNMLNPAKGNTRPPMVQLPNSSQLRPPVQRFSKTVLSNKVPISRNPLSWHTPEQPSQNHPTTQASKSHLLVAAQPTVTGGSVTPARSSAVAMPNQTPSLQMRVDSIAEESVSSPESELTCFLCGSTGAFTCCNNIVYCSTDCKEKDHRRHWQDCSKNSGR